MFRRLILQGPTAAEDLLGARANALRAEFDNNWRRDVKQWWQERHARINESKSRLNALEARLDTLSLEERFEHAQLVEEFSGEDAGLERYQALLQARPEHHRARFARGRILLEKNNSDGIADIEFVMTHDVSATQPGCELIIAFLRRQGRDRDARAYLERYWKRQEVLDAAEAERRRFAPTDTYLRHDLTQEQLQKLIEQISSCTALKEAYLVRKHVRELKEEPCYALFVLSNASAFKKSAASGSTLIEQIGRKLSINADIRIVSLDTDGRPYIKVLQKIPGALIVG